MSSCLTCDHPLRSQIEADRAGKRGWKDMASEYGIDQQALRRHFSPVHQAQIADEALGSGEDPGEEGDRGGIEVPSDATPREKLKIVTDALEERIRSGRYRSDDLREYRIALKDLHSMDREDAGPRTVRVEDIDGLPEFLEVLMTVLEPHPAVRDELLAELKRRQLEHVLG